jgi:hypothetical protein
MAGVVIELTPEEAMLVEAILLDGDRDEAYRFVREVIRPKIRAKGSVTLDPAKSTGILP